MSLTFTFTGKSSILTSNFFPSIELKENTAYEIGLLSFETYNSIPNVDSRNNKFHFDKGKVLEIPSGTYEIQDIAKYIQDHIAWLNTVEKEYFLTIETNNNTMRTTLKATFEVDFSQPESIGSLLGFKKERLEAKKKHMSDNVVDVFTVNTLRIECSIASGSFLNGRPVHTVHEFFPNAPAGYKIVETPSPVIYIPATVSTVDRITVSVVDQAGRLVDFRGEELTIRLHLRTAV